MISEKKNLIACLFVAFLALVVILTSVVIFTAPVEGITGTAGNNNANLANGGYVLEDEGFLFYSFPDSPGIYRTKTNNSSKSVKISDIGEGFLQMVNNTYYFSHENKLYSCDVDGKNQKVIIEYANKPQVLGSLIFYVDENGSVNKYTVQNKKASVVIDSKKSGAVKEYIVLYKRIYYISENGDIRRINFYGKDDEKFLSADASHLTYYDQYFFYLEDGYLYSKNKEAENPPERIVKATEYAVCGAAILYTDGEKAYAAEVGELVKQEKPKIYTVCNSAVSGISMDKEYFYFFDKDDNLYRISHNEGNGFKSEKTEKIK